MAATAFTDMIFFFFRHWLITLNNKKIVIISNLYCAYMQLQHALFKHVKTTTITIVLHLPEFPETVGSFSNSSQVRPPATVYVLAKAKTFPKLHSQPCRPKWVCYCKNEVFLPNQKFRLWPPFCLVLQHLRFPGNFTGGGIEDILWPQYSWPQAVVSYPFLAVVP